MKILIANDGPTAFYYIRLGMARAFNACGHQVSIWDINQVPANDVFDEFEPDLFIGQSYNLTRTLLEAIRERPHLKVIMKAGDWGPLGDEINVAKFPILMASEEERTAILNLRKETGKPDFLHIHYHRDYIKDTHGYWMNEGVPVEAILNATDIFDYVGGQQRPEFQCDLSFVGGYWGYKAETFDKWLIPLCNSQEYKIKIFGNSPWPHPAYCGFVPQELTKDVFSSALICPNLSEPHSQVYGFDVIERPFKLLSCKAFVISDYVEGLEKLYPEGGIVFAKTPNEFKDKIDFFKAHPDQRLNHIQMGYDITMREHTYFHRVAQIFNALKMTSHADHCYETYKKIRMDNKL